MITGQAAGDHRSTALHPRGTGEVPAGPAFSLPIRPTVPVKILITTFTYLPNKDGVAEACRMLAEGLAARGHDVCVATSMGIYAPRTGSLPHRIKGVRILDFDIDHIPLGSPRLESGIAAFRDFVKNGDFDVIVAQCWDARTTFYLQAVLPSLRAKRVMVSHGHAAHIYTWQPRITLGIGAWLRGVRFTATKVRELIRTYDKLVFLSTKRDSGRFFDQTLAYWMRHPGIEVISNGIDLDQFPETDGGFRARHGVGTGFMALCVANYSERKNQYLAVRAFREANIPGSTLVLIGSEFNEVARRAMEIDRRLAERFDRCKVIFLEKIDRAETFHAYVACDVFFLAAKAETQPIVLIEAMAAAKPWLSTDTGCVSEMQGGLVRNGARGLAEGLRTLAADPALRARLGAEGKDASRNHHDAEVNVTKFDNMLSNLATP